MNAQDMTKGQTYTVTTAKGDVTGTFVSVNSKGVNLNVDGKVISRSLASITAISTPDAEGDGYTTAEVAAIFDMTAKELRVNLRALGLGVGKGRRYGLTDADVATIREHLNA